MIPGPARRWRAVALALVIFVSGAVAGSALTIHTLRDAERGSFRKKSLSPAHLAARIRSRLKLDSRQEAAVARIFTERQAALVGIRRGVRPQFDAELEGLRRDVASVLTPPQAERWNRWFERRRWRLLPVADGRQ